MDIQSGPKIGGETVAYDVNGAAAASGLGRNVIYDAMNSGALVARKYGRRTVIMRDDLVRWLTAFPAYAPSREAA